jgi:uncharacterized repeat protein (TIGR01451 family)
MTIRRILPIALALVASAVHGGTAFVARSVTNDVPSRPLVRLEVTAATETTCQAYEEFLPPTVEATNITGGGVWLPDLRAIRWGPFINTPSVELTYRLVGPPGAYVPGGRLSADGGWAFTPAEIAVTIASEGGSDIPVRPDTAAPPVITPLGSALLPATVTMSCATTGAVIRYTLDGTVPDAASTPYTGAVNVSNATWIRARSFASNEFPSEVRSGYFSQAVSNPIPQLGFQVMTNTAWLPEIQIAVTPALSGVCWAYELWLPAGLTASNITENGAFNSSNGIVRWGPFVGRSNAVLACDLSGQAGTYSLRNRWSEDGQGGEAAAIQVSVTGGPGDLGIPAAPQHVARPVLSPDASGQVPVTVSASSATPGAELRYTTNGTAPTPQSALYTTALNFATATVLRVRGFAAGLEPSPVVTGMYAPTSSIPNLQVTRSISANGTPSPSVELLVVPSVGIKCFAVTESIPTGLAPYSISHNGAWDETNGVIRWGPVLGTDVVRLTYLLNGLPGTYRLVGAGSADGVGSVTTGPDTIEMAAQDALPDLVPAIVSFERASSVTYSVTNSGKGVASAHWTDRWYDTFYLSADTNLDSGDTLVGRFIGNDGLSLAAGAAYTATNLLTFPDTSGGDYYLILKTDERGLLNEQNKANNIVAIPITIPTLDGSPERVLAMPPEWGATPGDLDFSPDGVRLAAAAGNRVAVWNLQSRATATNALLGSFTGHVASVSTVNFSPANDEVLSGSSDGTIRIWDARTFTEARSITAASGEPCPAVFSSDGARVLGGAARGLAQIWDAVTTNSLRTLTGHSASITAVAFSPDGDWALTGSSDKSAILWNAMNGAIVYHWTNHTDVVTAVAFSRDGTRALTASSDGTVCIWNPATGASVAVLRQGRPLSGAVFSPDSLYVAAADRGLPGMAWLWEISSGRVLKTFRPLNVNSSTIEGIAFSPDRAAIATSHSDGNIRIWDSGLMPIPIHTAVPLPIGTDIPVTMQSHGLYYFEIDVPANRSLVVTVDAVTGAANGRPALATPGTPPVPALSTDVRFANRAQSQLAAKSGNIKSLAISDFPPDADIEAFRVLATCGHLPSVYEYDNFAQAYVSNLHAEVPLSADTSNKCYVLVFAPWLSAGQINATIRAEFTSLHLSSISQKQGGNTGSITIQVSGTGFGSNTVVKLTGAGGTNILGIPVYPPTTTEMELLFDLRSAVAGNYDVLAANEGEIASIPRGFEIVDGGMGVARVATIVPAAVRFGRTTDFNILIKNDGLTDIGAMAIKAYIEPQGANSAPFWVGVVPSIGVQAETIIAVPLSPPEPGCNKWIEVQTGDPGEQNCEIQDRILVALKAIIASEENTLQEIEDDITSECGVVLPQNSPERCSRLRQDRDNLTRDVSLLKQLCCNLCRGRNVSCPEEPDDCAECTELIELPQIHVTGASTNTSDQFCAVRSYDPNDMIGPAGVGPERLISVQDEMEYTIQFENQSTASAPVQELVVVDYLDPNLDWSTVEFGEITYGDRVITVPVGQLNFSARDLPPTNSVAIKGITIGQLAVDSTASFNPQNGRLEWRLVATDTQANTFPADALAGFLPPNNTNTHCGEGYVTFRVKPKLGLDIGTTIENKASIVFDLNDPIETSTVTNTIGQVEPKLGASIAYPASQMQLGLPFTMTLTVSNSGITVATNVVVTNAIPAGFTFVSGTGTVGTVTCTNGDVVWAIDTLSNGFPATLTLTLLPTQAGNFVAPIRIRGGDGLVVDLDPLFTVQPPLILGIRVNSGQVELFWPTNFSSFHVQRSSSLLAAIQWTDLTNAPVIVGQEYRVTNGPPAAIQFYRLSSTNVTSPTPPVIGIQAVGSQIQLSWPTNATGFRLQSTAALWPSAIWENVTNTTTTNAGSYQVIVTPSGSGRYFRLVNP